MRFAGRRRLASPWSSSASQPRDNELQRLSGRGGQPETIAANVTHLVVVMAALPMPDLYLTDRYLCAARLMGAASALAWNKSDVAGPPTAELALYETLGCPVWPVSAVTGDGIAALRAWIGTGTGILVGQSGVGKSSLLNALVPGADVLTGEISLASDEGRHTTTASVLHPLPGGGGLVDTPGVRDFVPAIPERRPSAAASSRSRSTAASAASPTAATCARATAPCRKPWPAGRSIRGATRATGG